MLSFMRDRNFVIRLVWWHDLTKTAKRVIGFHEHHWGRPLKRVDGRITMICVSCTHEREVRTNLS